MISEIIANYKRTGKKPGNLKRSQLRKRVITTSRKSKVVA